MAWRVTLSVKAMADEKENWLAQRADIGDSHLCIEKYAKRKRKKKH